MIKRKEMEDLFAQHGYQDFRWIDAKNIVVAQWVRTKCMFACKTYGKKATCPPNTPPVAECREFFAGYDRAVIFRFEHAVDPPEARFAWCREKNTELLKLERKVFLRGYYKAFLFFMDECSLCTDCARVLEKCVYRELSRPCPESFAVDVFATVRSVGYPLEVLTDYTQKMNRYAFLMIE